MTRDWLKLFQLKLYPNHKSLRFKKIRKKHDQENSSIKISQI